MLTAEKQLGLVFPAFDWAISPSHPEEKKGYFIPGSDF